MKEYEIGMYGGKFMPFHKGHRFCVETAALECEVIYVILFLGGVEERGYYCGGQRSALTRTETEKSHQSSSGHSQCFMRVKSRGFPTMYRQK